MYKVTVDSNVPIIATQSSDLNDGYASNKSLREYDKNEDVEELLGSPSPTRARSLSLRGRPPPSPRTSAHRSRSPSSGSRSQACSPDIATPRISRDQHKQCVVEMDKSDQEAVNSVGSRMQTAAHNTFGITGSPLAPFKVDHSLSSFYCTFSGFSPSSANNSHLTADDVESRVTQRINRSRSLTRLNGSLHRESTSLTGSQYEPSHLHQSVQSLQSALDNSESQRRILLEKLKEAQTSMEMQIERISKIESSAKNNSVLVESLKLKEMQYRNTISQIEASEEEKQMLLLENLQLREDMQNRINTLDYQLKSLKSQHHSSESSNSRNIKLLDHTTTALTLLEEENTRLQQNKEKLLSEIIMLKESLDVAKIRHGALDEEKRRFRNESVNLKEENIILSKKVQEMASQMNELRGLLKAVKDENERIFTTLKTSTEKKSQTVKSFKEYQDTITSLNSRLSATITDRDRLFQEKLDLSSKLHQMMLDKEYLMKTKLILDDQLHEQMSSHSYSKVQELQQNVTETGIAKEFDSLKKIKDNLTAELTKVKGGYERALEQVAVLGKEKSLLQTQFELSEKEKSRLQQEADKMKQMLDTLNIDKKQNQDIQAETIRLHKNDLEKLYLEKSNLENKIQELAAENKKMKDAEGSQLTSSQCQKLLDDLKQLQLEYNKMKNDYDSLFIKHEQLIKNGSNGRLTDEGKQETEKLKKEKEATQKQVAFLQGQMLLMEGSKKRADEQIHKLTSELGDIREQLRENNKVKSFSPQEPSSLQQEIEMLRQQLDKAKEGQKVKKINLENRGENSSEDMRSELQQTKGKLQEVQKELEQKDLIIEKLKHDLKSANTLAEAKQCEIHALSKALKEIKIKSQVASKTIPLVNNRILTATQELEQQTLKQSNLAKTLQEELLQVIAAKQNGQHGTEDNTYLSRSLNQTSKIPTPIAPENLSKEENSHHQNPERRHSMWENKTLPLPSSFPGYKPFTLTSKSWGPAPKASVWRRSSTGSSLEIVTQKEGGGTNILSSLPLQEEASCISQVTSAKKLPPPPPPKLTSMLKKSFISSLSTENTGGETALASIFNSSTTTPSSSLMQLSASTSSLSSGLGQSVSSNVGQNDSKEGKDVKVLINKFDEMADFL